MNNRPYSVNGKNDVIPEIELIEALSFEKDIANPRFAFYVARNIVIASFGEAEGGAIRACQHSHNAYEFIIPHSPLPYLTNDDAVYFGEVGFLYPVHPGRKHGIRYPTNNISYTSISFNEDFFNKILKKKGYPDYVFNCTIRCSESLYELINMFKKETSAKKKPDIEFKIEPLTKLICSEIIDLAVANTDDHRKSKAKYQKGVRIAADYINENFSSFIRIEDLADMCGLSLNYFSLCFKNTFGETPKEYITKMRLSKAKTLLEFSALSIKEISVICGFQKINSFSCSFKKHNGLSPSEFRESLRKN